MVPKQLNSYFGEARSCYALTKYLAAIVLCRTALQIFLNDIYYKNITSNMPRSEAKMDSLCDLIDETIDDRELKARLHKLRRAMNEFVHPNVHNQKAGTIDIYRETIICLHLVDEVFSKR